MNHTNIKVYALKLKVPLILFIAFWTIAIVLWQINGNIFFLFNFGYIGTAVGLGIGLYTLLPKKQKPSGRRFAQLLIGIYMLCFLGLFKMENVQTKETVFERTYKKYLEQLRRISFESIAQKLGAIK